MKKIFLLPIVFSMLICSCKKIEDQACPVFRGMQPPDAVLFVLKRDNVRRSDAELNNLKMSYYTNGQKKYVEDFQRSINEGNLNSHDLGIMNTRDIGFISAEYHIKDFYLEYQNGEIDSLFVDYRKYSQCEADTSSCQCIYPKRAVKYNGQSGVYDSSITCPLVYLFNKK